ncbi:MAG: hypothetical protein HXX11_08145 [Desulfuromonadales bacterium]|nr:hypothetical protein [Desulfuromonadales bacterium]
MNIFTTPFTEYRFYYVPGRRWSVLQGALFLLLFIITPFSARAETVVSAIFNNQGSFSIAANNVNRMTAVEIRIDYQSDDPTSPVVSSSYLDLSSQTESAPGSLVLPLKSPKPLSGYVSLAIVRLRGSITFLSAIVRNVDGTVVTPQVSFSNPSQEKLDEWTAQREKDNQSDRSKSNNSEQALVTNGKESKPIPQSNSILPAIALPVKVVAPTPDAGSSDNKAERLSKAEEVQSLPKFTRRESLFDRFSATFGQRSPAVLAELLRLNRSEVIQEPPLQLSDGSSSLRLRIKTPENSARASQFFIAGGSCTDLKIAENGNWILEIVPERGAHNVSVTVLAGKEAIEFPLAVVPPLALFEAAATSDPVLTQFVKAANELLSSNKTLTAVK